MSPPLEGSEERRTDSGGSDCVAFRGHLARYVDDELQGEERTRFEAHLAICTECARDVAVFRSLKGELKAMGLTKPPVPGGSIWDSVNRQIARPTGWVFLVIGFVLYLVYAVYTFIQSPMNLIERLIVGFVVAGFLILLASVGWERIRDYRTDPYKGVER